MLVVALYALAIGVVFGLVGYSILPNLVVLGPAAFIVSLLVFEVAWKGG